MTERRVPRLYVVAITFIVAVAALTLLTWFGVGPFGSVEMFILSNIVGFFALFILSVLGGAFVGLLVAHRIFSQNEFSPFERAIVQSLEEIKSELARLRERQDAVQEQLERFEDGTLSPSVKKRD